MTTYIADPAATTGCPTGGAVATASSFRPSRSGLWQNFGEPRPIDEITAILTRAFDLGITHFDLANNYGPANGAAESNFGQVINGPLAPYRDELVISTKAGYDMLPGPYGDGGSRKYMLGSLDASLRRMGLDYVDIFYSHRFDPEVPLEETMGALDSAVRQGKARLRGDLQLPTRADRGGGGHPLGSGDAPAHPPAGLLHAQPVAGARAVGRHRRGGAGCIVYSPLEQGILTDRYLGGVPDDSRASRSDTLDRAQLDEGTLSKVRALDEIASRRGQTMAQMALAWTQREPRVTSTLVGASSLTQLGTNVATIDRLGFTDDELEEINAILAGDRGGPDPRHRCAIVLAWWPSPPSSRPFCVSTTDGVTLSGGWSADQSGCAISRGPRCVPFTGADDVEAVDLPAPGRCGCTRRSTWPRRATPVRSPTASAWSSSTAHLCCGC